MPARNPAGIEPHNLKALAESRNKISRPVRLRPLVVYVTIKVYKFYQKNMLQRFAKVIHGQNVML